MISVEVDEAEGRLLGIVRTSGYLILGGALLGFSAQVYALLNRTLFSLVISISQYEAMSYFLGVGMPSFIIIFGLGYVFATTSRLKSTSLWHVTPLCILSVLSMVLSALSIFNILSLMGGFLVLTAVIKAYARPTFRALSSKEAIFFVEIGAMLVASFSTIFVLMWFISRFLQTYSMGLSEVGYHPLYASLTVGILAFLLFFTIPMLSSRGTNAGLSGTLGLLASVMSSILIVQNQYVFFNTSVFLGLIFVGVGITLTFLGDLIYIKLFFFEVAPLPTVTPSSLYEGKYCPYCGKPREIAVQTFCSDCARSLMWRPEAPFCPSCGRLISKDVVMCPHCQEDFGNKLAYFSQRESIMKSKKTETWIMKETLDILQNIGGVLSRIQKFFDVLLERTALTFKDSVYVMILTGLFTFLSFIAFIRVEPTELTEIAGIYAYVYGFPLGWLRVEAPATTPLYLKQYFLWPAFILDVILYFLLSFALVYGASRLRR